MTVGPGASNVGSNGPGTTNIPFEKCLSISE